MGIKREGWGIVGENGMLYDGYCGGGDGDGGGGGDGRGC